jgi:hypothetical protein
MASTHGGFPPPLTGGGDPAASGNVAQGLEAVSPAQLVMVKFAFELRMAEAVARSPGGEIRHRPPFSMGWGVSSPRTDGDGLRQDPPEPGSLLAADLTNE